MKKHIKLTLIAAIVAIVGMIGCIDNVDINEPEITITPSDSAGFVYFSWREPITFTAKIKSEGDLNSAYLFSIPALWRDSVVFDKYTHETSVTFKQLEIGRGYSGLPKDSIYYIHFVAQAGALKKEIIQRAKYHFNYPETDTFEITVSKSPLNGQCFIDIEKHVAYGWNDFYTQNYHCDLVFFYERGNTDERKSLKNPPYMITDYGFVSPDAEYLSGKDSLMWQTTSGYLYFISYGAIDYTNVAETQRNTEIGLISRTLTLYTEDDQPYQQSLSWELLTDKIIDDLKDQGGWNSTFLGNEQMGNGVSNIQKKQLYAVKLYNGRMAIIYIDDTDNSGGMEDIKYKLKIRYQLTD